MGHQYVPQIFHDPHKNPGTPPPPHPTYLMYDPLQSVTISTKWDVAHEIKYT